MSNQTVMKLFNIARKIEKQHSFDVRQKYELGDNRKGNI